MTDEKITQLQFNLTGTSAAKQTQKKHFSGCEHTFLALNETKTLLRQNLFDKSRSFCQLQMVKSEPSFLSSPTNISCCEPNFFKKKLSSFVYYVWYLNGSQ